VDLFVTLLAMGQNGYRQLLETRKVQFFTPIPLCLFIGKHCQRLIDMVITQFDTDSDSDFDFVRTYLDI
jgi:hypothetical protein